MNENDIRGGAPRESRKLKVGVMRGGPSGEYEVSLKTGNSVMSALRDKHTVRDIFIDKAGAWHIDGVARTPDRIFPHVDVVFNALHGEYGEDGRVQQLMDAYGIPYTGSKTLGSAIGMNKILAKKYFIDHGLKTPRHLKVRSENNNKETIVKIKKEFPGISIVKPVSAGSSLGVSVVRDPEAFGEALEKAFAYSPSAMIEEYIQGREATCGVGEGSRAGDLYALHPVEIRNLSENKDLWDYESKYSDELHDLICPGNFTPEEAAAIQDFSIRAHNALDLRHYSRSDFIVADDGIYILEVNTLPGLTASSLFPRALAAANLSLAKFLDHVVQLAVNKK